MKTGHLAKRSAVAALLMVVLWAPYAAAQEKLEKVYVGLAGLSGALAHAFIPKDTGLYEKFGLDVDLVVFQGGTQGVQALTGGTVQTTVISPPFDLTAKKLGYRILADMAELNLHYQHEAVATSERFLAERTDTARRFLKAFIAAIQVWMTDEKKTKEVLARRLRIKDKEVLDATYSAYKKLTERKPYPTLKGLEFQIADLAQRNAKAKGAKPENFVNLALIRELDKSGFIDALYK